MGQQAPSTNNGQSDEVCEYLQIHQEMKAKLITETNEMHFSHELEAQLTKAERLADMKLRAMGTELMTAVNGNI